MPRIIENRLIEEFIDRESFSREELFDFFRYFEPGLKGGTFGWRIYDLKNKNIIKTVRRGYYSISYKPIYKPDVSVEFLKVAKVLTKKFKDIKYSIWETVWLNEFTQHQSGRRLLIIEVEKQMEESVFYALRDALKLDIFLKPDEKVIDFYVSESKIPVVVKKLITRSPIAKRTEKKIKFYTPMLEKILVDLFADEKLFFYFQGREMTHLYENAISSYTINYTKLFSYAKRRERESEIKQFMINNIQHLVKGFIE